MNDLLNLAVEAHGGLKRWSQLTVVKASISITGELWQLKARGTQGRSRRRSTQTSAATRYGTISQSRFSTPIPVLSPKSFRPGEKTVNTGMH
jgi:hypothetical protein